MASNVQDIMALPRRRSEVLDRFHLLPAWTLINDFKGFVNLPRAQDARRIGTWWRPGSSSAKPPPLLVLFVSHRWDTKDVPDEKGNQLNAIRYLLQGLAGIIRSLFTSTSDTATRLAFIPSLLTHGILQAAVLAGRFDWTEVVKLASRPGVSIDDVLQEVFKGIVIFYDFACLPQKPRTKDEDAEFVEALQSLHELINHDRTVLVALRSLGDDFDRRMWCVAEASLALSHNKRATHIPFALRMDLMGTQVQVNAAHVDSKIVRMMQSWSLADYPLSPMQIWSESMGHSPFFEEFFKMPSIASCDSEKDHVPIFLLTESKLKWEIINAKFIAAFFFAAGKDGDPSPIAIAQLIRESLAKHGLQCTNDADVIVSGLIMLLQFNAPDTPMAQLYCDCIEKVTLRDDDPLLVRPSFRYRGDYLDSSQLVFDFISTAAV